MKERELDNGTLVPVENHVGLVIDTTSEDIFNNLNTFRDMVTNSMGCKSTNLSFKYTKTKCVY